MPNSNPIPGILAMSVALGIFGCDALKSEPEIPPVGEKPPATATAPVEPELPPLDEQALADATAMVASCAEEGRAKCAASAFARVEAGRLPESLLVGFTSYFEHPADARRTMLAKPIFENMAMFKPACADGDEEVLYKMESIPDAERLGHLRSKCNFARFGLVDAATEERTEPSFLVLVHMAFAHLEAAGKVDDRERALLLGILAPVPKEAVPVPG